MKKIQDKSYGYLILKKAVIALFRLYYKEVTILGCENIPEKEAPVIFAPVHQNALMDALAVHASYSEQIVFMMRGDAFSNSKVASFLRFIKIMPIFRMKEGYETLGKNSRYFEWAVDTLKDGKALGLMPEGNQREQRRLRSLVKGVFRIGFQAQEYYKKETGIRIIPVGLDYGDYNRTGKHLIINVGIPLAFSSYYSIYKENPSLAYNEMKEKLYEEMRSLIIHIDDEKNYARYYLAVLFGVEEMRKNKIIPNTEVDVFNAKRKLAERFPKRGESLSPEFIPLVEKADEYLLLNANPDKAFILSQPICFKELFKAIMFFGIIIVSLLLNGIPYVFIRKFTDDKFSHNGFIASASFIMGFFLYPVYWMFLFLIFGFIFTFIHSFLFFLMIAPVAALISVRIKYIYEDLFLKYSFRLKRIFNVSSMNYTN